MPENFNGCLRTDKVGCIPKGIKTTSLAVTFHFATATLAIMPSAMLLFAASSALRLRGSAHSQTRACRAAAPGWRCAAGAAGSAAAFDTERFFRDLQAAQARLCGELAAADGGDAAFTEDPWTRPGPSRGEARVLQSGALLEKAGVNTSLMRGTLAPARAKAMRARGREVEDGAAYSAAALSFVLHFHSPFLP